MNRSLYTRLHWSDNDGSIPHCILIASGRAFDAYYIYDAVGLDFGDDADLMRACLKPGAKRFEVQFPNGTRRRYTTRTGAKVAVRRHNERHTT